MKRDLSRLTAEQFDVLVIGGGIVGACVARDATLRGLRVALIEKADFAAGTSWNSLKIVHGGLRYLQQLDIGRMRASIRERSMWLRIAAHLVEPLPVLLPTYKRGIQRRSVMALGFAANDLISWDCNRGLQPSRQLPRGRVVSREQCLALVPEFESARLTGGAIFYDGRMYSAERLVLAVLESAAQAGAVMANYVEFTGPLSRNSRLAGVVARDTLAGGSLEILARVVVNASGPGAPAVAERLTGRPAATRSAYSVALNVMVARLGHRVAFAMPGSSEEYRLSARGVGRQLFFVPWRGHTLIGTGHYPFHGRPEDFRAGSEYLERFVAEVNRAWPRPLCLDDLQLVHSGLLPVARDAGDRVSLLKRHRIVDHTGDGSPRAISAVSVKFTTARLVAEQAVDLAAAKLGRPVRPCVTASHLLPGAPARPFNDLLKEARDRYGAAVASDVLEHLVRFYGEDYERILARRHELTDWDARPVPEAPVILAQWRHAVEEEMAQRPEDLVYRRTELGPRGLVSDLVLHAAAAFLGTRTRPEAGVPPGV